MARSSLESFFQKAPINLTTTYIPDSGAPISTNATEGQKIDGVGTIFDGATHGRVKEVGAFSSTEVHPGSPVIVKDLQRRPIGKVVYIPNK